MANVSQAEAAALPKLISHPSHGCRLTLFKASGFFSRGFTCDACRLTGYSWHYRCDRCDYDLHVNCASVPLQFTHGASRSGTRMTHGPSTASGTRMTHGQFQVPPQQVNGFLQPHLMQSASAGAIGGQYGGSLYRPHGGVTANLVPATNYGSMGYGLAASVGATALHGFVQSAARELGHTVMEDVHNVAEHFLSRGDHLDGDYGDHVDRDYGDGDYGGDM